MFGVGLQFHLADLLAVRRVAIPGAVGAERGRHGPRRGRSPAGRAGSWRAGLVFGVALSVASTVVLMRVLSDNRQLHTPTGHIAVGWLVVEDMFTVLVLVLMPALFAEPAPAHRAGRASAWRCSKVVALVGLHRRRRRPRRSRGC